MFGSKSPASFLTNLFDKGKEEEEVIREDGDGDAFNGRKRSQSMFAPNVAALISGDHVGSRVESMSSAMKDVLNSLSSQQYLNIPTLPSLSSVTKSFTSTEAVNVSIDECDQDVNEEEEIIDEVTEADKDLSLDVIRAKCDRLNDRRATDFSQANSDLQRFLALRKSGGHDDGPEGQGGQGPRPGGREMMMRANRKMYGSVEVMDNEAEAGAKRFRVESHNTRHQELNDVPSMPVLENPENQTKWYYKYFLGKLHQNLIGHDQDKNVFILSVLQEKSFGQMQYRAILWTKDGPKRLQFCGNGKSVTIKNLLTNFGYIDKIEKVPREIVNPNVQKDILWLEKQEGSMNFKFGVILAKAGQIMDDELFSNESGSQNFDDFLLLLGDKIQLKDWSKFRGGLDVRGNMTGVESLYTTHEEHEIMFHVSTLLPFSQDDKQQVERKRHIGNDIVNIIFVDGDREDMAKFKPVFIRSQFTHVYVVVCCEDGIYYLTVYTEKSVPLFGPSLPCQGFHDFQAFRKFMLVKCINGEKATYNTSVFSTKRERTFQILLEDAMLQFGREPNSKQTSTIVDTLESGVLQSYRKREDSRKDIFVKVGQSLKLENTIKGELGMLTPKTPLLGRSQSHTRSGEEGDSPWWPACVHPSLQMEVSTGDIWMGVGVLVAAREGAWLVRSNCESEKIFSITSIVQLDIMESLGILVFRTEKSGRDQSQVWVYRLSVVEQATSAPGREELREHALEASKGKYRYIHPPLEFQISKLFTDS